MATVPCILCKSIDTSVIESIDSAQLTILYKKRANVDVKRFFPEPSITYHQCNNCHLKFFSPQAIGDGKFYDDLQHYNDYYPKEKPEFIEGAKHVSPTETVLEIGCGEGQFTDYIKYKSYTGLEFSDKAIATASKKGLKVLKEGIEVHAIQHANAYDVVCFFQVLEHVEHPGAFMEAALSCLKPGGKLIIAVPSEDSFIHDAVNFYLNMPPHHASRWTDGALLKLAALYDLKVVTLFHEPLHPIHRSFYIKTKIYKKLSSALGMKFKSINTKPGNTILYGIAAVLSKISPAPKHKTGQSVMAIYQKK